MSEPMLFTWWMHDNRQLSQWLEAHVLEVANRELEVAKTVAEVDAFVADLDATLDRIRPPALELRGFGEHFVRDGGWRPGRNPGESMSAQRWLYPVDMAGDLDMLVYWPDKVAVSVTPVGTRLEDEPTPDELRQMTTPALSPDDESPVLAELTRNSFLYTPAYIRSRDREPAVYFTFDVTAEEILSYSRTRAFAKAAEARMAYLSEMCRAINTQVEEYRQRVLPALVTEYAQIRRQGLADLHRHRAPSHRNKLDVSSRRESCAPDGRRPTEGGGQAQQCRDGPPPTHLVKKTRMRDQPLTRISAGQGLIEW